MVERRIIDDPLDALVQLESAGVVFEVKGDKLSFAGLSADPATNEFFRTRLDLIREHKAKVIEWLGSRTEKDILAQFDKTTLFLADQVAYSEGICDKWNRAVEAWRRLLILAMEKQIALETASDNLQLSGDDYQSNQSRVIDGA